METLPHHSLHMWQSLCIGCHRGVWLYCTWYAYMASDCPALASWDDCVVVHQTFPDQIGVDSSVCSHKWTPVLSMPIISVGRWGRDNGRPVIVIVEFGCAIVHDGTPLWPTSLLDLLAALSMVPGSGLVHWIRCFFSPLSYNRPWVSSASTCEPSGGASGNTVLIHGNGLDKQLYDCMGRPDT